MKEQTYIEANSEMRLHMHEAAQRARRISSEMNIPLAAQEQS